MISDGRRSKHRVKSQHGVKPQHGGRSLYPTNPCKFWRRGTSVRTQRTMYDTKRCCCRRANSSLPSRSGQFRISFFAPRFHECSVRRVRHPITCHSGFNRHGPNTFQQASERYLALRLRQVLKLQRSGSNHGSFGKWCRRSRKPSKHSGKPMETKQIRSLHRELFKRKWGYKYWCVSRG